MRAWAIPGWNTGTKIKDGTFPKDGFVFFDGAQWIDESGDYVEVWGFENTDWVLVKEPKKKVKVKMYCPIYKSVNGRLWVGAAQSDKNTNSLGTCVGWQETEIEYEEI